MNKNLVLLLVSLLLLLNSSQSADTCRALVIDGDTDFGAYQAGAISSLIASLPAGEASWDVISGVSTGALNAAGLAQFSKGEEAKMSQWLLNLWFKTTSDDMYSSWAPGGVVHGIHYGAGVFDGASMKEFIDQNIQISPKRNLTVLTCDGSTGQNFRATERDTLAQIQDIVRSSVSPTFLLPFVVQDYNMTSNTWKAYVDGATCKRADISGAIKRCREIVNNDDSKIHLTIVYSDNEQIQNYDSAFGSAFDIYNRKNKIQSIRKWYREIVVAKDNFSKVNFDYVVVPSAPLTQSFYPFFYEYETSYNKTAMTYQSMLIKLGEQDALDAIKAGKQTFNDLYAKAINLEKQDNDIAITTPKQLSLGENMQIVSEL